MARILVLTESLDPAGGSSAWLALQIAHHLSLQADETLIITHPDSPIPDLPRVRVAQAHSHIWPSAIARWLPVVMHFRPDVLHVIEPSSSRFSRLHPFWLSPVAIKAIRPQVRSIVSVLGHHSAEDYKFLLQSFDEVLKHNPFLLLSSPSQDIASSAMEIQSGDIPTPAQRYLFVPGRPADHWDLNRTIELCQERFRRDPDIGIVLGGGWNELTPGERRQWLRPIFHLGWGARLMLPLEYRSEDQWSWAKNAEEIWWAPVRPDSAEAAMLRTVADRDQMSNQISRFYAHLLSHART